MLPYILYACLAIQIGLAIKLYMLAPHRRLNVYFALIPALYTVITILEIDIYYSTETVHANHLYHIYQCFAFVTLISSTLGYIEYVKVYTPNKFDWLLKIISISVIAVNALWTLLLVFYGPSAHIFLAAPGKWSIDRSSIGRLFLLHTYSSIFWLVLSVAIFVYLMFYAESKKKKIWFGIIAFFEFIVVVAIIAFVSSHEKSTIPQFDIISSIPTTILVFLQLWVLSGFSIFDINIKNVYDDVLSATNNWIIILAANGTIRFINEVVMQNATLHYFQLIDCRIDDVLQIKNKDGSFTKPSIYIQEPFDNHFNEIIIRFKKNGNVFNLQLSQKKLILPDKTEAYLWVLIDTTLIETLKVQKEVIEATSAELKKANSDIKLVMNITSHDLKSPLATLVELVDLVEMENKRPLPNRSEEYLAYIKSISLQALALSKNMIEFLKVGATEKKKEWIKVSHLISHVKDRIVTSIEKKVATITYEGLSEIYCDPKQIRELLFNFIENAIKYQDANLPLVEIKITETQTKYQFFIKDNGIGIDEDFIPKLFEAYSREGKGNASGSGMGLFLCKNIIEANNGEISVKNNKPENGLTIFFTIEKDNLSIKANRGYEDNLLN